MENTIIYIPQTQLLVKYDTWSDYKHVGQIPSSFLDLVKLFSAQFYPNNFSINFLDTNFHIHSIDNESKYNELVYICKDELKLMINIYKEQQKSNKKLKYYCDPISEENSSGFSSNCESASKMPISKRDPVKKNKGGIECY
jgi:hypothetical protein